MKPNVLHIVSDFLPFGYGEQAVLLAAATRAQVDHQFFSTGTAGLEFLPQRLEDFGHDDCPVHPRNWLGGAWALRQRLRREPATVVHAWGPPAIRIAAGALAGSWGRGAPGLVVRYHRDEPPPAAARNALSVLYRRANLVWVVEGTCPASATGGDPLHAWITFDARQSPLHTGPTLRELLRIDAGVGLVGVASPLEVRRGLKHLVWGADLAHWLRDLRLVVWGSGPQQVDLQRYARQIAARDHYLWLPPASPLRQQMLELDLLWDPSRRGLSPVARAAVAHGIPVITFTPPELLEPQRDRRLVHCVPWGARDELARATARLLEQPPGPREYRPPHPDTAAIAAAYSQLYARWSQD